MQTLDPSTIDRDVAAVLDLVLDDLLRDRLEEAQAIEGPFASDIARRVAAFTTGGHRRRSRLLWWAMRAVGGEGDEVADATMRAAAAIELVQTCALIHDDVMDGSLTRRGEPAVHVALDRQYRTEGRAGPGTGFGRSAAVLAGDLALAWADDVFTEALLRTPHSAGLGAQWRAMRTEMVAGQYLDVRAQVTGARSRSLAFRTAVLKTACYSAVHPLLLGARLAGAGEGAVRELRRAGMCAGIAFQLENDLQGVFGDPARTGKPAGEDLREGKATYLLAVGRALCVRRGDTAGLRLLETVVGSPSATDDDRCRVRDLLDALGALGHVTARVDALCARAVDALRRATLVPGPAEHLERILLDACGRTPAGLASDTRAGVRDLGLRKRAQRSSAPVTEGVR
ncbi:polyprenyl synthetase family protein [Streptomyces sp. NPDC093089]|uniref:polyprenyl synthetase family protein n=1 Tax=Streptomyces sp. NPDC093089 TaxID=3366024 RepID=UPI00380ACB1B